MRFHDLRSARFLLGLLALLGIARLGRGADEWPQFRGPTGDGHAARDASPPTAWSERENVAWKTAVHDRGWSSPVIWENQIWLTTGRVDGKRLFAVCIDRETGRVVHDLHLFDVEKPEFCAPSNSYASPTSVVEAGRVYVHFGTNGTACIDAKSGRTLWTRRDLNCEHEQGAGSSPLLVGDLFVVNVDGRDVQYVIALDKATGRTVWKTNRSVDYSSYEVYQRKAYCMPIVVPRGAATQLVSPGAKALVGYDTRTGRELWKVRYGGWSMAPRPLYGHGLVFAVVDYDHPELWAIRPDGDGDVTETHVTWKLTKGVPSRPSLLLIDDLLFFVTSDGVASCVEAKSGDVVWKKRIAGKYSASPIYAGGCIYFCNEDAVTTVIRPGRKFDLVGVNRLDEDRLMASPAAVGRSLFLRTEKFLYRLDAPR